LIWFVFLSPLSFFLKNKNKANISFFLSHRVVSVTELLRDQSMVPRSPRKLRLEKKNKQTIWVSGGKKRKKKHIEKEVSKAKTKKTSMSSTFFHMKYSYNVTWTTITTTTMPVTFLSSFRQRTGFFCPFFLS
jgi:hypothetical protein